MPAAHRSFYTDMHYGGKYWTYIGEELPLLLREIFPFSPERRDNFAAGLSMGGYGAIKLALSHPDRYAAAASLSGAMDILSSYKDGDTAWQAEIRSIFGDMNSFDNSPDDLYSLARKTSGSMEKPRLYQICGTEDFLYQDNVRFRNFIQPLGYEYTYEESPGDHSWDYWDEKIKKVLAWIKPE
jgi:S-formylglutathione hydrolase FrmB